MATANQILFSGFNSGNNIVLTNYNLQTPIQCNFAYIPFTYTILYSMTFPFTFTNMGATGSTGPGSISYGTSTPGYGTSYVMTLSSGIQSWTVPQTGIYTITATGAGQVGNSGFVSYGITVSASFSLSSGQVIKILVGQSGLVSGAGGGCGGSYVVDASNNPIIIAGGAGGNGSGQAAGGNGQFSTSGGAGSANGPSPGGSGGSGGGADQTINSGFGEYGESGGGGFNAGTGGNGQTPNYAPSGQFGGRSFLNGGVGGNFYGGFGGGGGIGGQQRGGGGGGGYSGGGGGGTVGSGCGGGGGGSYCTTLYSATGYTNVGTTNSGQGSVVVQKTG